MTAEFRVTQSNLKPELSGKTWGLKRNTRVGRDPGVGAYRFSISLPDAIPLFPDRERHFQTPYRHLGTHRFTVAVYLEPPSVVTPCSPHLPSSRP